jgi:hypothetical protein
LPSTAEGVSDRLSELTPLPVVVNEARDVGQPPSHRLMLLLGRERYGACLDECAGELGEDGQVGVKLDALKATDPERQ